MKSKILVLAALVLFFSCETKQPDNVAIAKEMFGAFNNHDWKKMAEYYSEQAEFLDPSLGTEYVVQTREQLAAKYTEMQAAFPDIRDDIKSIYADADKVIVEFVSSGSSGDSIRFKLPIISVLTFKDKLIVRDATYYDK